MDSKVLTTAPCNSFAKKAEITTTVAKMSTIDRFLPVIARLQAYPTPHA
jgi:hypothetical protein